MEFTWTMIIGLCAAALTTIGFLPQAIKTLRTKNTRDLSLGMYLILSTGVFLWLLYGLLIMDLPVILANAVTFLFVDSILILKLRYK